MIEHLSILDSEMLSSMMVSKRGVGPESKRRQQELEGNGDIRQQMQTGKFQS